MEVNMKQGQQLNTVLLVQFQQHEWISFWRPENGGLGKECKVDKKLMARGNGAIPGSGYMAGAHAVPLYYSERNKTVMSPGMGNSVPRKVGEWLRGRSLAELVQVKVNKTESGKEDSELNGKLTDDSKPCWTRNEQQCP